MVNRNKITELIAHLLNSALERNTQQGVIVFKKGLDLLKYANSDNEVIDVLKKLNNALVGIEAHGQLTQQEYSWIQTLRTIEEQLNS